MIVSRTSAPNTLIVITRGGNYRKGKTPLLFIKSIGEPKEIITRTTFIEKAYDNNRVINDPSIDRHIKE